MKQRCILNLATIVFIFSSFGTVSAQLGLRPGAVPPNQSKEFQLAAARKVDKLVGAEFRRKQVRPLPKSTDAEFLRRSYLTAIGRIPGYEEAVAFLDSEEPGKRVDLIDTLLGSYGYNMHMFNWWADLLRATDNFQNTSGAPYIKWIKDAIAEDKPYNKMVHELVAASGGGWQNGAVGYYMRDKGMLKDNMANTTRIFLGTRIECAQCHNHPFDSWKQMEFYEMAAFTSGMKIGARDSFSSYLSDKEDEKDMDRGLRDVSRLIRYAVFDFSVADAGDGSIHLPKDYKYRDAKPGERVGAKSLSGFGKSVRVSLKSKAKDAGEARLEFADWIVSPQNPRFTKVIANRMWKRVMGTGLFEPLDNFSAGATPSNPALMAYLEELLADLNYDLKAFQKVLFYTYTFQLGPNPLQHPARSPYNFNGRQLKRFSAEQVWDSLLTLKVDKPDARKGNGYGGGAIMFRNRPVLVGKKSMKNLYSDVISLESPAAVWKYTEDLYRQIKNDKGGGGGGGEKMKMKMMMAQNASRKYGEEMRASELSSPMPNGHFLRQFGQSDREVIENSSTDSDVTQVLSILNGHVEKHITSNSGAKVFKVINAGKSDGEKIDRIFLSVLSRMPSEAEKEIFLNEFKMDRGSAVRNAVSALISTAEFMFVQ
ncbi:MAG: DUF1549 domain-containing protein [Verrucomicrobiales bacterium]